MTGEWNKKDKTNVSASSSNELIKNMESVYKLAIILHSVWHEGDLHVNYSTKYFSGDNIHPLVQQGLINLGFNKK